MSPLPGADGRDLPRRLRELVPGIAALVEDISLGLWDRFEGQLLRVNCRRLEPCRRAPLVMTMASGTPFHRP